MRIDFLPVLIAVMTGLSASDLHGQDSTYIIKGHIISTEGTPVEYVAAGIPGTGIGTVSSRDGEFVLTVPADKADTLEFHHVSYNTGYAAPDAWIGKDSITVILSPAELAEAVVLGGTAKEKTLVDKGARFPAAYGCFRPDNIGTGREIGSIVKVKRPFLIQRFSFKVASCSLKNTEISLNVYKIDGNDFMNILTAPVYIDIRCSSRPVDYDIDAEEHIMLEPGEYFISLAVLDCSDENRKDWEEHHDLTGREYTEAMYRNELLFPLYFKSSYVRNVALGQFSRTGFNIGMTVSGLEFQE